ncbi:hypothetical protein K504DRAFT_458151 [Pleomassaria siparia CBS 279.74]|uniref:Metallothionein n=1 Tax=Pleomassaria siparia CBS 279.74 TaxID=1314801 RepID=A0A6G1K4J0_9PLEO|nr:hypothetical protein K504DRAFT_458151 [Pleomassaria siparia CBS 279.74]
MKASFIIAALFSAIVMATPAAVSIKRATRVVMVDGVATVQSCVECPCNGWTGDCKCVTNGCCC